LILLLMGLTVVRLSRELKADHSGHRRLGAGLSAEVGLPAWTESAKPSARRGMRRPRAAG